MKQGEGFGMVGILWVVATLIGIDIFADSRKGVALWHVFTEGGDLNEVADVGNSTEKTARGHSMTVYAKSWIPDHPKLSQFFIKNLLLPASTTNKNAGKK